jgi:hypothetical protein
METILTNAGTYAGELIIAGLAIIIRSVEIRFMIRKKRKEWESGETYSKIEGKPDKK